MKFNNTSQGSITDVAVFVLADFNEETAGHTAPN